MLLAGEIFVLSWQSQLLRFGYSPPATVHRGLNLGGRFDHSGEVPGLDVDDTLFDLIDGADGSTDDGTIIYDELLAYYDDSPNGGDNNGVLLFGKNEDGSDRDILPGWLKAGDGPRRYGRRPRAAGS